MPLGWIALAEVGLDTLRLGKPKQSNIDIDKLNLPCMSAYVIEVPHDFVDVRVQHHKGYVAGLSVLHDVVFVLFPLSELLDEHG